MKVDSEGNIQWERVFTETLNFLEKTSDDEFIIGGGDWRDSDASLEARTDGWIAKLTDEGEIAWKRVFGGNHDDRFTFFKRTTDGGFLVGGALQFSPGYAGEDFWVVKMDMDGVDQWEHSFGGTGDDRLESIELTEDGGYLLSGRSDSPPSQNKEAPLFGRHDAWLLKLDARGKKLWDKSYGSRHLDYLESVRHLPGGSWLLGGNLANARSEQPLRFGAWDYWVVNIDIHGDVLWERWFGGEEHDRLVVADQASDHGYVLGGYSTSPPSGNKEAPNHGVGDIWLVRTDDMGNKLWEQSYGGEETDILSSLQQTEDQGYLLAGLTTSPHSGNKVSTAFGDFDIWLIKTDDAGNKEWDRSFGGSEYDRYESFQRTEDGGYILLGNRLVIKLDAEGQPEWEHRFTGIQGNDGSSFDVSISEGKETADGGYLLSGSYNIPFSDFQYTFQMRSSDPNVGVDGGSPVSAAGCCCFAGFWGARLDPTPTLLGYAITWDHHQGATLESTGRIDGEWISEPVEVVSVGAKDALVIGISKRQRFYRLQMEDDAAGRLRLNLGTLISWPVERSGILETASDDSGPWEQFQGSQGIVSDSRLAIISQEQSRQYFRIRNAP